MCGQVRSLPGPQIILRPKRGLSLADKTPQQGGNNELREKRRETSTRAQHPDGHGPINRSSTCEAREPRRAQACSRITGHRPHECRLDRWERTTAPDFNLRPQRSKVESTPKALERTIGIRDRGSCKEQGMRRQSAAIVEGTIAAVSHSRGSIIGTSPKGLPGALIPRTSDQEHLPHRLTVSLVASPCPRDDPVAAQRDRTPTDSRGRSRHGAVHALHPPGTQGWG